MKTDWIHYFGYGSLVNRQTRPAGEIAYTARLNGWRRVWNHRVADPNRNQPCTSLSIEPCNEIQVQGPHSVSAAGIDGVVVRLPMQELPQLDVREAGYDRLSLPLSDFDLSDELAQQLEHEGAMQIMVYRSQMQNRIMADERHPVLRSYIDCVLSGYLQRFGADGVLEMINSTRGWELPFLDDRRNPCYPRWVPVSETEQRYFDRCIEDFLRVHRLVRLA